MSAGYMYSANTTAQTVPVGGTINMGAAIRRFGCVKNSATPVINANSVTTTLSSCDAVQPILMLMQPLL